MTADVFKAISDPMRRAILDELVSDDGRTLFQLCAAVTARLDWSPSRQGVSQHIAILVEAGLVDVRKEGRFRLHFVNTAPLQEISRRWYVPTPAPADAQPESGHAGPTPERQHP